MALRLTPAVRGAGGRNLLIGFVLLAASEVSACAPAESKLNIEHMLATA